MAKYIRTLNMQHVIDEVKKTEARLRDPRRLLYRYGIAAIREIGLIFRAGGKPKWKPLAPSTRRSRRQGKGNRSPIPLRNTLMEESWQFKVSGRRRVRVESISKHAIFHEKGTKGPYPITPKKPGGVLAIPGRETKRGVTVGSRKSLAGLTISRGGSIFGKRRLRERSTGAPRIGHVSVFFRKAVKHPGLARRRMTPTEEQLGPALRKETIAHIKETMGRAMLRG